MGTDKIFPDNWKEIIDGKKVIFYNTSVGSLLQGREKHIEKMRWVFQTFQEHPEVVLWWRPHPLELSTIESMAPELVQQYLEMRAQYVDKKTGILDESADVHRAIAVSDAYYGDWSSVVHLYRHTGKPILHANDINLAANDKDRLMVSDFVIDSDRMWVLSAQYNYLFEVMLDNMDVKNVFLFPVCFPYTQEAMKYIINRDQDLLILSRIEGRPIFFDVEKKKLALSDFGVIDLSEYSNCYAQTDEYIYAVSKMANKIIKIRKYDMAIQEIVISGVSTGYEGIAKTGKKFVLIQAKSNFIFEWDEETGELQKFGDLPSGFEIYNEHYLVGGMITLKDSVIVFPQYTNMVIEIDIIGRQVKQVGSCFHQQMFSKGPLFTCAKKINNVLYIYANYLDEWIIYNLETKEREQKQFILNNQIKEQINSHNIFDRGDMDTGNRHFEEQENCFPFSLSNYAACLKNKDIQNQGLQFEGKFGKAIYETLKMRSTV